MRSSASSTRASRPSAVSWWSRRRSSTRKASSRVATFLGAPLPVTLLAASIAISPRRLYAVCTPSVSRTAPHTIRVPSTVMPG